MSFQSKIESSNAKVLEEMKLLNEKFNNLKQTWLSQKMQTRYSPSHLVDTEGHCLANSLCSRRDTLVIVFLCCHLFFFFFFSNFTPLFSFVPYFESTVSIGYLNKLLFVIPWIKVDINKTEMMVVFCKIFIYRKCCKTLLIFQSTVLPMFPTLIIKLYSLPLWFYVVPYLFKTFWI